MHKRSSCNTTFLVHDILTSDISLVKYWNTRGQYFRALFSRQKEKNEVNKKFREFTQHQCLLLRIHKLLSLQAHLKQGTITYFEHSDIKVRSTHWLELKASFLTLVLMNWMLHSGSIKVCIGIRQITMLTMLLLCLRILHFSSKSI